MSQDRGGGGNMGRGDRPWITALEGFYGPPLSHEARLELIRWLPSAGLTGYAYGPKDDPWHRDIWREPYPAGHLAQFEETVAAATSADVDLAMSISPGLDWRGQEDDGPLVAKLRQLYDVGVRDLGIQWDDIPPGGEDLGRTHGRAVAAAMRGLPDDVRWMTVGVDYATAHVTAYLRGFADELPREVSVGWTGPSVTSPEVPVDVAQRLANELDRPIYLGDNFPVNDLGMSAALHLGPAPYRDPALRDVVAGVGFNMMSRPLASRVGLAVAARHWADPTEDREDAWREVVAGFEGLGPLARSCRSWVDQPGPDAELRSWLVPAIEGDERLPAFLGAGCRAGLDEAWQQELEPWLLAWEAEARVMQGALGLLHGRPDPSVDLGVDWPALHRQPAQVFGLRFAVYGLTWRNGDLQLPHPDTVVRGDNLTDELLGEVLGRLAPPQ